MENIKHYFASANTGNGFINYFNYINDPSKPAFRYILKGGPGTGKSTLMKKVGEHFSKAGFQIEYFHCSSDPNSLDGVRVCEKNICIVDGTAPHIIEAELPEITDKIINVGEFIKKEVRRHERHIESLKVKKMLQFKMLYEFLSCASRLYKMQDFKQSSEPDKMLALDEILSQIPIKNLNKSGYERKLFISAVSENGIVGFENSNNYTNEIQIHFNYDINNFVINSIKNLAIKNGYETHAFYGILNPSQAESLYLKECDIYIKTKSSISPPSLVKSLIKKASASLKKATCAHKQIEKYYSKHIDFAGINALTKAIISDISNIT